MKFLILAALLFAGANAGDEICLDGHVAHHLCMGSQNYNILNWAINECSSVENLQEAFDNNGDQEDDVVVVESRSADNKFDFYEEFMRASAQRVCIFRKVGFLREDYSLNEEAFGQFISQSRLAKSMDVPETCTKCHEYAEMADPNTFFKDMDTGMTATSNQVDEADRKRNKNEDETMTKEERIAARQQKKAEREAKKAEREAKKAKREAKKAERAQKKAEREQKKATRDEKKAKRAEKKVQREQKKAERAAKKAARLAKRKANKNKKMEELGHTMIAVSDPEKGEVIVDIKNSYDSLTKEQKEDIEAILYPLAYFKCVKAEFDSSCHNFMNTVMTYLAKTTMQQAKEEQTMVTG